MHKDDVFILLAEMLQEYLRRDEIVKWKLKIHFTHLNHRDVPGSLNRVNFDWLEKFAMFEKYRLQLLILMMLVLPQPVAAQFWMQNDAIFNPSGIPSLPFSQPRFADLDADGDFDMMLGSTSRSPFYFENTGTISTPAFHAGTDLFAEIPGIEAEMGVGVDLDDDGDLDFICGGFLGLQLYENIGSATAPQFQKITDFFTGLDVGMNPVPTLADMDGDADYDLLVGLSENGVLKFYPNSGTAMEATFSESASEVWYDVGLYAYPCFSDLDSDGDIDLLTGRDNIGFYYYRNGGTPTVWQWQSANSVFANLGQTTYWNSPSLVDLTGDGKPDLVYGTASGPLNYYRNTGTISTPAWTLNTSLFGGVLDVGGASSPVFFDFDSDGDLDLISGSQMGDIKFYKNIGTPYAPAWQANHNRFAAIDHSIYSAITVGDVNGDGLPDAIVGDLSGNLYYHRNIGATFALESGYFTDINFGGFSVPRLVDMDHDRDLDLVVGNENGQLHFLENVGSSTVPSWQEVAGYFGNIDVGSNCVPTCGDYDDDGDFDILTGDLFHELQYFENTGNGWVENTDVVTGLIGGQNAAPAFADLDLDGDLDLTIGNYDGTFNYFDNEMITSISDDSEMTTPQGFTLFPAYPNPFNPSTTISYFLPENEVVTITVYGLDGRMIQLLANENQAEGQHLTFWNGRDQEDQSVASGVYLVRISVGTFTQSQKVILMK